VVHPQARSRAAVRSSAVSNLGGPSASPEPGPGPAHPSSPDRAFTRTHPRQRGTPAPARSTRTHPRQRGTPAPARNNPRTRVRASAEHPRQRGAPAPARNTRASAEQPAPAPARNTPRTPRGIAHCEQAPRTANPAWNVVRPAGQAVFISLHGREARPKHGAWPTESDTRWKSTSAIPLGFSFLQRSCS